MKTFWVAARKSAFSGRPIYWCKDGLSWRWLADRDKAVPYATEKGAAARAGENGFTICVQVVASAGGLSAKTAAEGAG